MVKFLTKQEKKVFIKSVAIAPDHVMLCLDSRIMLTNNYGITILVERGKW